MKQSLRIAGAALAFNAITATAAVAAVHSGHGHDSRVDPASSARHAHVRSAVGATSR